MTTCTKGVSAFGNVAFLLDSDLAGSTRDGRAVCAGGTRRTGYIRPFN